ncbi:DUF2141 domain-containing protein [Sphingobium sp. AN558]|uniref:DUF2141 domain-containing protein n=1 Tax=Sphingobium sp. AN558 TaxID=3133442 RepID=UPI0030C23EDB
MGPLFLFAAVVTPSSPDLGKAEGKCRPGEHGPAFLVEVKGLKDRQGRLKLELYPSNDSDFLADDNVLLSAGKIFRRVEISVPSAGPVSLCIRAPAPGTYALGLLHDRNGDRKFTISADGIGFAANPRLGLSKPKAAVASATVGASPVRISITLNYRKGLLSFGPLEQQ